MKKRAIKLIGTNCHELYESEARKLVGMKTDSERKETVYKGQ